MKILHIVPTYYPAVRYGGPIQSVHGLASALATLGHEVHVYTTNIDGNEVSQVPLDRPTLLDDVKVWYFETGVGRRIYRSPSMHRALVSNIASFDIVHLHSVFLWPTYAGAQAATKAGVPYVLSPRGMLVRNLIRRKSSLAKHAWITLFERRNIEKAATIHATSDIEASELRALGFQCARVAVVANGIELPNSDLLRKNVRESSSSAAHRPYVLFLGRLNWKKGLDRLIPAMTHVKDADLMIAGNDDENYQPELEALARKYRVLDRVHFLGAVHGEKKWKLLASAKILVLPSYSENFGNVVLEAMASSCAVIVTPEVGAAHIVREAGCGVISSGEPENLSQEINQLLSDQRYRQTMGDAGRRVVEAEYSWNVISHKMLDIYYEIREHTSLHR